MMSIIVAEPPTRVHNQRRQAAIDMANRPASRIMSKVTRVGIYLRVSTDEQVEGFGLDSQESSCTTFVDAKCRGDEQWVIHRVYRDEGESGAKEDRPAIKELEADVRAGLIDVVVVCRFDRIGRTGKAFWHWIWALQDAGVSIVSTTQNIDTTTNDGKTQLGIYATFSEMEWNLIRERTQNGLNIKAREGGWIGGRPPYGYEIINKGSRNSKLGPCAAEIKVLEKAAEFLVNDGLPADQAAAKLNALGSKYLTRSGKPWRGANLRRKFFNTALDGFVVFRNTDPEVNKSRKRKTVVGPDGMPLYGPTYIIDTDIIIPLERIYEVREALRGRSWNKSGEHHYYSLSKRIFGNCGKHYFGQFQQEDGRFYRCSGGSDCSGIDTSIPAQDIEDVVWNSLKGFFGNKEKLLELAEKWIGEGADYRALYRERQEELKKEAKSIQDFLGNQLRELSNAGVDPVAIAAASSSMADSLKKNQKQQEDVKGLLAKAESDAARKEDIRRLVELASFNFGGLGDKEKSELMDLLEIKVKLKGPVPRRWGGPKCPVSTWFKERGVQGFPELTDDLWARIEPHVPVPRVVKKNTMDARSAVDAALYKLREGVAWTSLPETLPQGPSVRAWVVRQIESGAWEQLMAPVLEAAAGLPARPLLPPLEISGNIDPRLFDFTTAGNTMMSAVVGERSWG
ncbi:recombinase family protein [Streptomyces tubercidicus]|uniref:recombinase family protein n=1 Tax=Streptomyces tubercidicus TaxID=47759 RepID=UPI003688F5BB